jgi:ATP-dependent RNA helicase DeaD
MTTFDSLGLNSAVLQAVSDMGFVTPTPIQEQAIPALLSGTMDLVALAQTGTGKTAAFGLPILTLLDFNQRHTQAVVLAPTRELCIQITKDLNNFASHLHNVNIVAVYGGASITNQITELKRGAHIIVATPGRLVDLLDRKKVHLDQIRYAVLDEADEMLNMGFKDDLDAILSRTPDSKNTWLFSATMPDEVSRISKHYMNSPMEITVAKNQSNENIEHVYYLVNNKDRYLALKRIADYNPDIFAIVFCRTKIETQQVADALIKDGYNADALHGDLSQAQRDHVMNRYRSRNLQMLVATDVAARGIDVNDVTHVINYNLPDEIESYTHRSGRTARAGKKGVSIALLTSKEVSKVRILERLTKTKFTQAEVPNGMEVCGKQLVNLMHRIHDVAVDESAIADYLPSIYEEMKDLDKEEILKRFVSLEFNRFLEYYRNAPDLNVRSDRGSRGESGASVGRSDVAKLFINLGKMDNVDKGFLTDYISHIADIPKQAIKWVGIKDTFSFVEVKPEFVPTILDEFRGQKFKKRPVRVELRDGGKSGDKEDSRVAKQLRPRSDFGSGNRGDRFNRDDRGGNRDRGGNNFGNRGFGRGGERRESNNPVDTERSTSSTTSSSAYNERRRFDFSFNDSTFFNDDKGKSRDKGSFGDKDKKKKKK